MKKFRKIAAVLLCVVMIAASLQCLAFAAPQDSGKLNFLVLGDSIAEGFGVENKEDAAYGKIVADTNGYNYRNLAQVANDTQDLIRKIETVDEFRESIAWADVINICIGSNNYLASKDVVWITIGALFGTNDEKLDEIAYGIYDDFNTIYSLIREINPDATLIFDNIYCAWKGLGHIPFIKAVSRINAMLNKFAAKHDDVVIFDTSAVISHNTELLADDCVHPNTKGNVELARHMLILLKNPYAIASISLQLSFSAVAGLVWLTPKLTGAIHTGSRLLRFVLTSFATTLGALAFSTPLGAYYFGTFSVVSLLSNLLCLWMVSLVFGAGLLGLLLSMTVPAVGAAFVPLVSLGVRYVLFVSGLLEGLPLHALYFNTALSVLWLLYVYALFAVCAIARRGRYRWWIAGALAVMMLLATARFNALQFERGSLHVTALDVGQGESVALLSRRHGVLVDCGSSNSYISAGDVAADYFLSAGIRRLDAVVLTHYHADHANGLALLLARVGVDTLYLPDIAEENGEKTAVLALSERYGVEVRYVTEETQTAVGEVSLTLYPPVGERGANELGLTILCSAGEFDTLITGDMDSRTERVLMSSYPLPDIEVLLVGHHGSRYSTSEELLETVTPEVGVVSVGSNSYGHPTRDALLRLTDAGVTVYRTDLQGNIYITVN